MSFSAMFLRRPRRGAPFPWRLRRRRSGGFARLIQQILDIVLREQLVAIGHRRGRGRLGGGGFRGGRLKQRFDIGLSEGLIAPGLAAGGGAGLAAPAPWLSSFSISL